MKRLLYSEYALLRQQYTDLVHERGETVKKLEDEILRLRTQLDEAKCDYENSLRKREMVNDTNQRLLGEIEWLRKMSKDDITYNDHLALQKENERLQAYAGRAMGEVARLMAEVEWLRKADRLVCWNPATQAWEVRFEAPK